MDDAAPRIRLARSDEASAVQALEDAAGELFRELGWDWLADAPPMDAAEIARAVQEAGVFVLEDVATQELLGYALVWWRQLDCHLRELDVRPEFSRRGFGGQLLQHVMAQARARGCSQVILTTFRDVVWNAPWYRRLGFREFEPVRGSWVFSERLTEQQHGLDRAPRVALKLTL